MISCQLLFCRQSLLHHTYVGCIKALMNSPVRQLHIATVAQGCNVYPILPQDGRAHVLAHPTGITIIAQSIRTRSIRTKILGLPTSPSFPPCHTPIPNTHTFSQHLKFLEHCAWFLEGTRRFSRPWNTFRSLQWKEYVFRYTGMAASCACAVHHSQCSWEINGRSDTAH